MNEYTLHIVWKLFKIMSHLNFPFCSIKSGLSGNIVGQPDPGLHKLAKLAIFGIFNELLSTQNVNVAHLARNVEWDFF